MPQFTRTEKVILNVLADGKRHKREEVIGAVRRYHEDDTITLASLAVHTHRIRRKLQKIGEDIHVLNSQGIFYCHVRLLGTDDETPRKYDLD